MMKTRIELLTLSLTVLILLSFAGCSEDDPASPGDTVPPPNDTTSPKAVADLRVESVTGTSVTLTWTAPGDDGDAGTASEYDIRYSSHPITEANWEACTQATAEPEPAASGTGQSVTIDTAGKRDLHFGLKTADEASNWSGLSNVVTASVDDAFVVRQLTNEGRNYYPCVDDGFVVWVHFNAEDKDEIYIANLESVAPNPTRLTDNGGEKAHPSNAGSERVVWQGRDGSHSTEWEIWIYNRTTIPRFSQFTNNDVADEYPNMAGGGDFAWLQGYTMYEEVRYWDEFMHRGALISDACCPSSKWSNGIPSAHDGAVVWRCYDRYGEEGHKIHLWESELTDPTDLTETLGSAAHSFSLYAGTIAYVYGDSIRYWDGSTVVEVDRGRFPSLYDGAIAYLVGGGGGGRGEIRYWDGTTIHEITNNDHDEYAPSFDGSTIVWAGWPPGSQWQIFYCRVPE
jgi:hypothetical protein